MREQLDFEWNGRKACRRMSSSQRRRSRMRWWFEQMREAVEKGEPSEGRAERFRAAATIGNVRGEIAPPDPIRQEREKYEYTSEI